MILAKDTSNLFEFKNEFELILYKQRGNNFKYKQILVDFNIYKNFNIERVILC